MLNIIKNFTTYFLFSSVHYENCYSYMERKGVAAMGCCCGDDEETTCTSCPHFVELKEYWKKKGE